MAGQDINHNQGKQIKVLLWTIPRSMSTILAKCMCGIEDVVVFSEVFSWPAGVRAFYTKNTGKHIPEDLEGNEAMFEEAIAELQKRMEATFSLRSMS